MNVLHVIPSLALAHGGPSVAMRMIEAALRTVGANTLVATTDDDGPGRRVARAAAIPVREEGAERIYFRKWTEFYKLAPGFAFWALRNTARFDVVHIHALFSFTSVAAAFAARRSGVPYIVRPLGTLNRYGVHGRRPWLKRLSLALLERPLLRHAAAVHFTSEEEAAQAGEVEGRLRRAVIPLAVPSPAPAATRGPTREFPSLGGAPYLLYLSRLDAKKNVASLLRAFASGRARWGGLKLLIAGDGSPAHVEQLHRLAASLGLQHDVVWAGHVDGERKQAALAGALAFVLPSYSENFGIAAAEALAAGLPCVLGRGVAIAGEVEQAGAGLCVAPDPEGIRAGLGQVIEDDARRASMAAAARQLAQARYSMQAMGASLLALYSEVTAK